MIKTKRMNDVSSKKICSKCHTEFECNAGNIEECQCKTIKLTDESLRRINELYLDCLCAKCLIEIQDELLTNSKI